MKYIGYTLLFVSALMLIGTVGGIEHNTMPLAKGAIQCVIWLALMFVGVKTIERYEEEEND